MARSDIKKSSGKNKGRKTSSKASRMHEKTKTIPLSILPPAGRFVLESRLGVGGLCEVFLALDLNRVACGDSSPKVAIKRILPEYKDNPKAQQLLAKEFFTLRHLIWPGIVRVFDLHKENWGLCISMEYLEGKTAQDHMAQGHYRDEVCNIAGNLFLSLDFLHKKGIRHGDIKPANICCEKDGRVVLFDFNTAELAAPPGAACAASSQGLMGELDIPACSLLHASPERLSGGPTSREDDIFAASCTLYELASGKHPFKRMTALEAREKGLRPEKPELLSRSQWKLLEKGLSFEAGARPVAAELYQVFKSKSSPMWGIFKT